MAGHPLLLTPPALPPAVLATKHEAGSVPIQLQEMEGEIVLERKSKPNNVKDYLSAQVNFL